MGIHHTYKNSRGEKKILKQMKRKERRHRKEHKQEDAHEIPLDTVITLDHLTDPNKK